jgi:HD domain
VIAEVTEGIHNDEAPGTATARPRRAADQFAGLPIAQAALRFASARHAHQHREIDHALFIGHPIEVGSLLHRDGQRDEIIAAGLLHDVLEKTATTSAELHRRFGAQIARFVESVSDDPSLGDYKPRKRELRDRVAHADAGTRGLCGGQDRQSPRAGVAARVAAERTQESRQARPLPRQPRDGPAS